MSFAGLRLSARREHRVDEAGERRADYWRYPEEPQLRERPPADEQRGPRRARGVDRGVSDGDAYEVNQRQREPDGERRHAGRRAPVCRAENDDEEEEGHHDFADECGGERVIAGRVLPVAVRGEAGRDIEARLAARNQIQNARSDYRADDLRDDVWQN